MVPNTVERLSRLHYEKVMTLLSNPNDDILVGTDLNFDHRKIDTNSNVSDLLEVFFYFGYTTNCNVP